MGSFIADRIRIAKDGTVTTTAEQASPNAAAVHYTAKQICFILMDVVQTSDCEVAKMKMRKVMEQHNFAPTYIEGLLNWMACEWRLAPLERKAFTIVDYFHKRCP
jgi:hypothetical protein